jgi:DUF2911 family protein
VYLSAILALTTAIVGPMPGPIVTATIHADTACAARNVPVPGRKSPLDSISFTVSKQPVKLCYGRPSSRGRVMLGGKNVPYGKLWRTGANEPTIFFAPIPLSVAGLQVPPGVYSLYTVPGPNEWEIIVNRSISQWGEEGQYTDEVKAQELGRAKVKSEKLAAPVETFTIRAEPAGSEAKGLLLEWEKTRVRIPIAAGKQKSS